MPDSGGAVEPTRTEQRDNSVIDSAGRGRLPPFGIDRLLIAPTSALALPLVGVVTSHLRKARADGEFKDSGFL